MLRMMLLVGLVLQPCHGAPAPESNGRSENAGAKSRPRALCIGIDDLPATNGVRWAEMDAIAVGSALKKKGYEVVILTRYEATKYDVYEALLKKPTVVYYAGHAGNGRLELKNSTLPVLLVAYHTRFLLLDCCLIGAGLRDDGETMVFAAGFDYVFETGGSGLFTKYLVEWLQEGHSRRNRSLVEYVTEGVVEETGGWQRPVLGRL